jgi:hypothetical protein
MVGLFDITAVDKLKTMRNKRSAEIEASASQSKSNFSLFSFLNRAWKQKVILHAGFRLF